MAYVDPNFKTKKALVAALAAGDDIRVYEPGSGAPACDGVASVEGPHFPEPHRWYAHVAVKNGRAIEVLRHHRAAQMYRARDHPTRTRVLPD